MKRLQAREGDITVNDKYIKNDSLKYCCSENNMVLLIGRQWFKFLIQLVL